MKLLVIVGLLVALCGCAGNPSNPPLSVPPTQAFAATLNTQFTAAVSVGGGVKPYSFSIVSGAMPPGLTMDPVTGVISGTPTIRGTFHLQVQVQDSSK